jgi:pimeloyl-ACP methyl ester carboxylesterase
MKRLSSISLAAWALVALSTGALAAKKPKPDAPPVVTKSPAGTIEVGTLQGTPYRIDIPANWNHGLVVFYHGYAERPYTYGSSNPLNEQTGPLFDRGFAVIQSGYSATGWALEQAYPETEELRQYFLRKYGQADGEKAGRNGKNIETIVAGASMGGALVTATLELNPKTYLGGLDLCGQVGPTYVAYDRRFAWRAAFDFYFPGVMPPLVPTPASFEETPALRQKAEAALKSNPAAAAELRNLTGLHTDREVARDMVYFTFVIGDLQARAGGNPFDNSNILYAGTTPGTSASDNALNDGVHRYTADPKARVYLVRHFTPSGRLQKPMLALHTTYDPLVPIGSLTLYSDEVQMAGFGENLVQQYVHREGHCTFTRDEVGHSFDELLSWVRTGQRPTPGLLK